MFLKRRVRLVILGDGPERETLLELAERLELSEHVDLPGFKVNPFTYMSKAGVFVLSSRYEGFPNVLVQAMACGAPVVSTDCRSGPREILEDGKWGHLVPVGDWRAMAEAILETLDNPIPLRTTHLKSVDLLRRRFHRSLPGSPHRLSQK